jgi:hypothetical protein
VTGAGGEIGYLPRKAEKYIEESVLLLLKIH